ncbi:MAG: pilus assembly protein TadG-related protein, partial [Chloroflexota bacterium]
MSRTTRRRTWARAAHRDERGTVSVMAAFLMMGLVGMLALVVDVGYAYGQRRMAQNVADRAAVAAAKVLARHIQTGAGSTMTDADVAAAMADIAAHTSGGISVAGDAEYIDADQLPLVPSVIVGQAIGGLIPVNAFGVRVQPDKTFPAFFASALGFQTLSVAAEAKSLVLSVASVDQDHPDYAPFIVWGGNPEHLCASPPNTYGCNLDPGDTV